MNKNKMQYAIFKAVDDNLMSNIFLIKLGLSKEEADEIFDKLNSRGYFDTYEYFYDGLEYDTLSLSEKGEKDKDLIWCY